MSKFKFEIEQTATGNVLESGEVQAETKGKAKDQLKEKLVWHQRRSVYPTMIVLKIDGIEEKVEAESEGNSEAAPCETAQT